MSNNPRLHHNPLNVELVKEITPKDFQEWITQKLGGIDSLPQHIVDHLSNPEAHLAPLLDVMTPGDTLWLCRSQKRGLLYGHEGVALVRDDYFGDSAFNCHKIPIKCTVTEIRMQRFRAERA